MRRKTITRCMILALAMVFMTAGAALAGVGGSDTPTVTSPVAVGQTGLSWSFTIANTSTTPNNLDNVEVVAPNPSTPGSNGIYFTTTCGSSLTPAVPCPLAAQEAPGTIAINPLTGVGAAGTACAGVNFTVAPSPTGNPNEYVFYPATTITLGPSGPTGGTCSDLSICGCTVNFSVDVNSEPVHDSSGNAGLQTSQLAVVPTLQDTTTQETGFAAGSSTIAVQAPCLHVVKSCNDATTCDGDIGISVDINNCGTEALNINSLTDDPAVTFSCTQDSAPVTLPASLAVGAADIVCTASYTGTQGQLTSDTVSIGATGALDGADVSPDETSVLSASCNTPLPPGVTAEKTCTSSDLACDATSATFNIHVCNTSQVAEDVTITDSDCGTLAPILGLAAGTCTDVSCTSSNTSVSGVITNSGGTVSASANGCTASGAVPSATCPIPPGPSVTAEKTCTSSDLACDATSATFNIHVCNTATVDEDVTITDSDCGTLAPILGLAAGTCTDVSCTSSNTSVSGVITNSGGTVSASANSCTVSSAVPSSTCPIPPPPSVTAEKTCNDTLVCTDTSADFNIHVCNTATVDEDVTITDADCGTLAPILGLAAGTCTDVSCTSSNTSVSGVITNSGGTVTASANSCTASDAVPEATCTLPGCPCQINLTKAVAPDDGSGTGNTACDGIADGPFTGSVTVQPTDCVVYQFCASNSCVGGDCQDIDASAVTVTDTHLGISTTYDFGTLVPGADPTCIYVPTDITDAGSCPNGTCVCQTVEGPNTVTISNAICETTQTQACDESGSVCTANASVACVTPVGCRMTGGHNNMSIDAEYDGYEGTVYTTGGQIGAPTNVGCCPEGPTNNGRGGKDCPWGEWEHNHHSGPDDSYITSGGTTGIAGGAFAFHSGTSSAPKTSYIADIICADPGWCVQARPAPVKQIYWEGIGVFHNMTSNKGQEEPLPYFEACANQPVPYDKKSDQPSLHYYRAHVADFGEPAGVRQKDPSACEWSNASGISISACELADGYTPMTPAPQDQKFTDVHPLCAAQDCGCDSADDPTCQTNKAGCPDYYEIEIHCTTDPASPIAYKVAHFITEGNFQLHPAVGDSCNPSCGNGICEPGVPGATTGETCSNCPEDCGPCID